MNTRIRNLFSWAILGGFSLVLTASFQNCGSQMSAKSLTIATSAGSTSGSPRTESFAVSGPAGVVAANLGSSQSIPVSITPLNGFKGRVDVSLESATVNGIDLKSFLGSIPSVPVTLDGKSPASVVIPLQVPSEAPSTTFNLKFTARESSPAGAQTPLAASVSVSLAVVAVYEIKIQGGASANETWSAPAMVRFSQHTEGLTIRFINASSVSHTIHSAGPIPHQSGALAPGQIYEYKVMDQTMVSDTYYCHDHENATTAVRTLVFNAFSSPVSSSLSGNVNAKYSYVSSQLLNRCQSCHTGIAAFAGVRLDSYGEVMKIVVPGSAQSSGLYLSVYSGQMPKNGTPLTASELQNLKDWINDGAQNN